jgi:ribulose bisphosphate carboxylase small subunit
MDMVKCFIDKQFYVNTGASVPLDSKKSNYKLFEGLEVMKDMAFVNEFVGKYPVIKVNFYGTLKKLTEVNADNFCKTVIRDTYLEHEYLTISEHLDDDEIESCREWCHNKKHRNFDSTDTGNALKELSKYLYKHHNEKVFMLVDEYDSLPMRAMFGASEEDCNNITSLPVDIIAPALRYGEHVAGAILTGISYIAGVRLSVGLKIDKPFRFLDMGKLDKY